MIELFVYAVVRRIVEKFTAAIIMKRNEKAMGVTMLSEEICVLCRSENSSPPAIRVFQNRNPFRFTAHIDIGESIKVPKDIGSSDEENCFFVIDYDEKCVWKIARQTDDQHKFLDLDSIIFFQCPPTLPYPAMGMSY